MDICKKRGWWLGTSWWFIFLWCMSSMLIVLSICCYNCLMVTYVFFVLVALEIVLVIVCHVYCSGVVCIMV